MRTKKCTKCGKTKKFIHFAKGKKYKDGRRSSCKDCMNAYMVECGRRYRDKPGIREKISEYGKNRYATDEEYRERQKKSATEWRKIPANRERRKVTDRSCRARKRLEDSNAHPNNTSCQAT